MARDYVERRHENFYRSQEPLPLADIVCVLRNDETRETIQSHFPALSTAQVYSAIAFCPGHQQEVESDLAQRRREEEKFIRSQPPLPPELSQKLDRARRQMSIRRRSLSMLRFRADVDL